MHWEYMDKPDLTQFGFVYCITNMEQVKLTLGVSNILIIKKVRRNLNQIGKLIWDLLNIC